MDGQELMPTPLPAPPLQASAPGSAVDYPLTDLAVDTNYTATVRGLRGPNFTSPASITFTTGRAGGAWGRGHGRVKAADTGSPISSYVPRAEAPPGLGGQGSDPSHGPAHLV